MFLKWKTNKNIWVCQGLVIGLSMDKSGHVTGKRWIFLKTVLIKDMNVKGYCVSEAPLYDLSLQIETSPEKEEEEKVVVHWQGMHDYGIATTG